MARHPSTEGNDLRPATVDVTEPDGLMVRGSVVGQEVVGFPTLFDGGLSVSIPNNHQQLVSGSVVFENGELNFGDGAELRFI